MKKPFKGQDASAIPGFARALQKPHLAPTLSAQRAQRGKSEAAGNHFRGMEGYGYYRGQSFTRESG